MNIVKMITMALVLGSILALAPVGAVVTLNKVLSQWGAIAPLMSGTVGIALDVLLVLALMGKASKYMQKEV